MRALRYTHVEPGRSAACTISFMTTADQCGHCSDATILAYIPRQKRLEL
jgi:hypothetical protein